MIYPNEKEIEKMAKNAAHEQCELLDTYSAHSDSVKLGAAWAIAEIQKRLVVGREKAFENWQSDYDGDPALCFNSEVWDSAWQVATIAAEARHQEALRVRDAEIAEWQSIADEYSKLIDHCTRGLLSKANLKAKTVISVMEERQSQGDE